ncbi:uncharacterized protein LOC131060195 [Cryptomeria japonica]|uniref:uncharacterized protein LOC131060195 n=1 Tax=Cryptomeria japonica TaxID=3369 RepID=UPI0027DA289B|nr:uncharacterized protein LOC131060195 [Cryptomeria japonica]
MDERFCIQNFILGLRTHIGVEVDIHNPLTMNEVFEKSTNQEQKLEQLANFRKNVNTKLGFGNKNFQNNDNHKGNINRQIRNLKRGANSQEKGVNQGGNKKVNNNTNFSNSNTSFYLIDIGDNDCFIDPKVVYKLPIRPGYVSHAWMVQYGNRAEKRVDSCVFCSDLELPNFQILVNLYVAPLRSYDVILGINCLTDHKVVVNCEDKVVSCLDDYGTPIEIHGSQKPLELRHVSAMQLKKAQRKGYSIFSIFVSDLDNAKKSPKDYLVLIEFLDVFPEDLTKLPPKREFDFSIELLPGTEPQSKAPYRMTTIELYDLKDQL